MKILLLIMMPWMVWSTAFGGIYEIDNSPFAADIARHPGDILTVIIDESATTVDKGTANQKKSYDSFEFVLEKLFFPKFGLTSGFSELMGGGDTPGMNLNAKKQYTADANHSSTMNMTSRMQVRVIDVISRNQMLVKGYRTLWINGQETKMFVSGVIREKDITVENTIYSAQIADAIVEIDGEVVKDLQPGILEKLLGFLL